MRALARLLGCLGSHRWRVALAVALGAGMMASNVGLLSVAAYLIAASALQLGLSQLTLPMFLVQMFGISRAALRYAERLVSHDVTFKLLASLRTWLYGRLEPLSPASLLGYRSGYSRSPDLLPRLLRALRLLRPFFGLRDFRLPGARRRRGAALGERPRSRAGPAAAGVKSRTQRPGHG